MFVSEVANSLVMSYDGVLEQRGKACGQVASLVFIALFLIAGVWVYTGIDGFVITAAVDPNMLPNPLNKTVDVQAGA